MKEREFYIPSSDGVSKLHCMEWVPEGEVKAVLQITHGMVEHIGRYREFAEFLAGRGIAVYGHDHLGHGKTAEKKEDLGFFGEKGGSVVPIKDIRRLTRYGKKRFPGVKLFLLGHSMGSFFARRYLSVYPDGPDGVILTGTGGPAAGLVAFAYLLSCAVCGLKGSRCRCRLLYELSLGNYNRQFKPVKTSYDWLTRDEERTAAFEADPDCQFIFTAGAYRDFFRVILEDIRAEKRGKVRTDMPMLFLSGEEDPVGEKTKGVRRVYEAYDQAGAADMTIGFYSGARHEVLNETNREEVFEDIYDWLVRHALVEDEEGRQGES